MAEFRKTKRTTITRLPKRGEYDKEGIYAVLDEALFCTLAFMRDDTPFQIPTGFCRIDNALYIHGSVGSSYMRDLVKNKKPVCISATLMDGLVLARAAFHHSVNYRSVVLFSVPEIISDEAEQYKVLEAFTNKMQPGRWTHVRKPSKKEWKATLVLSFKIEEASAKVRSGHPIDDEEDYNSPIWAGVIPLQLKKLAPIPDPLMKPDIELPAYLK